MYMITKENHVVNDFTWLYELFSISHHKVVLKQDFPEYLLPSVYLANVFGYLITYRYETTTDTRRGKSLFRNNDDMEILKNSIFRSHIYHVIKDEERSKEELFNLFLSMIVPEVKVNPSLVEDEESYDPTTLLLKDDEVDYLWIAFEQYLNVVTNTIYDIQTVLRRSFDFHFLDMLVEYDAYDTDIDLNNQSITRTLPVGLLKDVEFGTNDMNEYNILDSVDPDIKITNIKLMYEIFIPKDFYLIYKDVKTKQVIWKEV